MINSDFFLPALFYTHSQLLRLCFVFVGFLGGFILSCPSWGSQGGGKRDKETFCQKPERTQGAPGRGDERMLVFDNEGAWVSLIKPADTQCWAAQNPREGVGKDKSSRGPEGPTFCSTAVSDELKAGEAQAEIPSCAAAPGLCSSFLLPSVVTRRGKMGLRHPLGISSACFTQTFPASPDVPFKEKSLLCLPQNRENFKLLVFSVQLLHFTMVSFNGLKQRSEHLSLCMQEYMYLEEGEALRFNCN